MISSSRLAELQRAPPAWKFCAVQSQERFDRENAQRADQAKMNGRRFFDCWKWIKTKKTSARGRNRAVTTRKDREEVEVLRGSLHGVARVLQAAKPHLRLQEAVLLPGCRWGPRPEFGQQVGLRASQKVTSAPINPNLDSSPTDLETCRKYKELKRKLSERALTQRKARAREEPSLGPRAQRRTHERRATSPAAGPRRAHGSAAAKRARHRKCANLARSKICDFGPEL